MKKISILLSVIMLFSIFSSVSYGKNDIGGNSPGNIVNGGEFAEYKGWTYYSYGENGFYKVKNNGSELTKICEKNASNINIVNDTIYCYLYDNSSKSGAKSESGIYMMRIDGSMKKKLNSDEPDCMNAIGDWIYYSNLSDSHKPYKMKLDGTGRVRISQYSIGEINVSDGWIYFENHNKNASLYKMKTDGSYMTQVSKLNAYRMRINLSEGWLYFVADYPNTGLYKIRSDGTMCRKLDSSQASYVNVAGDYIFYSVFRDGIYRMKTDGTGKQRITDEDASSVFLVNGYIYYSTYDGKGSKYYRIKTTGGKAEKLYGGSNLTENNDMLYVINGVDTRFKSSSVDVNDVNMLPAAELLPKFGIPCDSAHIAINQNNLRITGNSIEISMDIGSKNAIVNGYNMALEEAPVLSGGVFYIPVVSTAKALGKYGCYDKDTSAILISDREQYNKIKDLLCKTDNAMKNLNKYRIQIETSTKTIDDKTKKLIQGSGSFRYEIDNLGKKYKGDEEISLGGTMQLNRLYMNEKSVFIFNSAENKWVENKITGDFSVLQKLIGRIYELSGDSVCAGLTVQEGPDSTYVMSGDIMLSGILGGADSTLLSPLSASDYITNCHTEIIVNKDSGLTEKITVSVEYDLGGVKTTSVYEIVYDSNDNFEVQAPEGIKNFSMSTYEEAAA